MVARKQPQGLSYGRDIFITEGTLLSLYIRLEAYTLSLLVLDGWPCICEYGADHNMYIRFQNLFSNKGEVLAGEIMTDNSSLRVGHRINDV
jgi:hypothetical protein